MRASRLLAILIVLQNRGRMTAEALAAEFEVSERTIYRDIDALSMAGVPIYGDRGPGGGFGLLDGYRTRLTGLADEEAAALALSGVPSAARDAGFGAALRDAFGKLFAALPGEGGVQAGEAAARFHIDPLDWYRAAAPAPHLPDLARAVLGRQMIRIAYSSWTGPSERKLAPLGLVLKAGEWYLAGHRNGRTATYRVAAIARLEVLAIPFTPPPDFALEPWWRAAQAAFEARLLNVTAHLRISPLGAERLARQSARAAQALAGIGKIADWAELQLPWEDSDHGARDLLRLGPEVEVLAPASLRARVAELAQAVAQMHR
jgi:predicted DNA-binding transcriptional regulator YafY